VMKVIMGVFLQVTFYVASNDDVIMMSQKERALKVHTQKMTELFVAADENGNGRLDQDEFETIISDPTCIAWLSAMGFETSMLSGQDLYRLLCAEGTNDLSAEELCKGVAELKGP
ncbi:scn4aa, partial [Symbiodinium necroappetens]